MSIPLGYLSSANGMDDFSYRVMVPDGVSFPHSIDGAYESLLSFKEKKKKKN
jgi:hypothetical protein